MKETLKGIGSLALLVAMLTAVCCLITMSVMGGVWLSRWLLPIASVVWEYTFAVCILILIPMAVFQSTRSLAAFGLFISSYIFGLTLWMAGLLISYSVWGPTGVVFGLFCAGLGVIPVALLATLFNGLWAAFFSLIVLIFVAVGTRSMALYLFNRHEQAGTLALN